MFKPEYILDNVALFGIDATVDMIKKKFQRMGKKAEIAYTMAHMMVINTIWTKEGVI